MVAGPLRKPDHEDKALLEVLVRLDRAVRPSTDAVSGEASLADGDVGTQPNLLLLDEPTNGLDSTRCAHSKSSRRLGRSSSRA
jgi:ABC-type cobalamin/Fe3+-siderophores transport system ATPase subunit